MMERVAKEKAEGRDACDGIKTGKGSLSCYGSHVDSPFFLDRVDTLDELNNLQMLSIPLYACQDEDYASGPFGGTRAYVGKLL
jgi:hypothetical protein